MKNSKIEIRAFTSDEICAIIKQCGHSGVREFSLDKLKFSFGKLAEVPSQEPVFVPVDIQNHQDSQAREAIDRKEIRIKEDLVQSLQLEDPEAYEKLLAEGELVDEESDEETEE